MITQGTLLTPGSDHKKRLVVGVGNEYRRDDGIGVYLAERASLPDADVMTVGGIYPELAETLHQYDMVVFVDAAVEGSPVELNRIFPDESKFPLFHHITCGGILALTEVLYHTRPDAYLLSVRGYDFGHGEGLSENAQENLKQGLIRLEEFFQQIGKGSCP
jgi:hydrogenase maturation protease